MTPEQIGKAGELQFDTLCNEVALTCAVLIPDLLGVDRYIEFLPPPVERFGSLDQRPAALSCYVQVKSKGPSQRYWKLSLSVAERLAKSAKPAFVLLFEVGNDTKVSRGYLAHLRGDLLERVLERLRDADRKGIADLNHRTLNLSRKDGLEFELTGLALTDAIRHVVGPDMTVYGAAKAEERDTVGFGEDRHTASVRFGEVDWETLVDAHLGEGAVPVEEISFTERRFNISLPAAPGILTGGLMTITPSEMEGCELRIRHKPSSEEATLACSVMYPALPNVPVDALKFRINTDLISIKFSGTSFKYTAKLNDDEPRPLSNWQVQLRFIRLLHSGHCELFLRRLSDNTEVRLGASIEPPIIDLSEFDYVLGLLEAAAFLKSSAREPDEPMLLEDLLSNPRELRRAYAIMSEAPGVSALSFKTSSAPPEVDDGFPILFISAYNIGGSWFAYCARTNMSAGSKPLEWRSDRLIAVGTEALSAPILQAYESFRDRMGKITGVSAIYIQTLEIAPDGTSDEEGISAE